MNPQYREIRTCIDSFVDDMARIVERAITEEVQAELDRLSLAMRPAKRPSVRRTPKARAGADNGAKAKASRAPRKRGAAKQLELPLANAPKQPTSPPPLFVHKRARDGKIHHLSRAAAEAAAAAKNEDEAGRQESAAPPG
jgi:hypothetical protein